MYFAKCWASVDSVINGMKLVLLRTSHLMKHYNGGYIQLTINCLNIFLIFALFQNPSIILVPIMLNYSFLVLGNGCWVWPQPVVNILRDYDFQIPRVEYGLGTNFP